MSLSQERERHSSGTRRHRYFAPLGIFPPSKNLRFPAVPPSRPCAPEDAYFALLAYGNIRGHRPADSSPGNAHRLSEILQRRCPQRKALLPFEVRSSQTTRKSVLRLSVHSACVPVQHLTHRGQKGPVKGTRRAVTRCPPGAPRSPPQTRAFSRSESRAPPSFPPARGGYRLVVTSDSPCAGVR